MADSETRGIEFTDRYGGRMPSALRGCRRCSAFGYLPPAHPGVDAGPDAMLAYFESPFIVCPACDGSARVAWWRSALRVPRWAYRGARFAWEQRPGHGFWDGATTRRRDQLGIVLWAAFGADLGLPMYRRGDRE